MVTWACLYCLYVGGRPAAMAGEASPTASAPITAGALAGSDSSEFGIIDYGGEREMRQLCDASGYVVGGMQ